MTSTAKWLPRKIVCIQKSASILLVLPMLKAILVGPKMLGNAPRDSLVGFAWPRYPPEPPKKA